MTDDKIKELIVAMQEEMYCKANTLLCHHQEAMDIVQETVEILCKRKNNMDNVQNLRSYCLAIVRNLSLKHLQKKNVILMDIESELEEKYCNHALEEEMKYLNLVIEELPPLRRKLVEYHDLDGLKLKKAADLLNISCPQAKKQLWLAHKTLKERITKYRENG